MAVRIDTFKPKPLYGQYLMELAPSHNDPINELGWLWSKGKEATAYALARAIKSAERRRAGARDKFDKSKFHGVITKLSNMLGFRKRLGSLALVNPRRKKRKNPSAAKRRAAARGRSLSKYGRLHRAIMNANWNSRRGNKLLKKRMRAHDFILTVGGSIHKRAKVTARRGRVPGKWRIKKNPSAAWGRARKAARGKWLKRRFGMNPPRSKRTGRFIRRGRR